MKSAGLNSFYEAMVVVHIKHQDAMSPISKVVANTRNSNVEIFFVGFAAPVSRRLCVCCKKIVENYQDYYKIEEIEFHEASFGVAEVTDFKAMPCRCHIVPILLSYCSHIVARSLLYSNHILTMF